MRSLILLVLLSTALSAHAQVFDDHVHLWHGEKSLAEYKAQLTGLGDVRLGAMWFGGPNQALAGSPEAIRAGNDGLLRLAERHPEVTPIATVHPYDGEAAIAELERVAKAGVKVLKIHPHTQRFDASDPRVLTLVQRAGDLGMIVLMDNANILPGDSEKLFNLALQAPNTKFIFAHIGGLNFRFWNVLRLARTAEGVFGDNIYFDIAAIAPIIPGSPLEDEFVWTLRSVGIDHVLLGSDFPQFTLKETIDALDRLKLTSDEKAKIRYLNAKSLFGLQIVR